MQIVRKPVSDMRNSFTGSSTKHCIFRYTEALEVLDSIISADPTNSAARKRRIALLKAQGHLIEAITELVDYLNKLVICLFIIVNR